MRICYIWVSAFKNLKHFGINLCNDLRFSFSPESGVLRLVEQTPLPSEIFGENIHDISAILGINGAGKSNALELICLALKSNEKIDTPLLIVYEKNEQLFFIKKSINYLIPVFDAKERDDHKDFKDLNVVYFSNVFDENKMDLGKHVQDISTNFRYSRKLYPFGKGGSDTEIIDQLDFISSDVFHHARIDTPKTLEIKIDRTIRQRPMNERNYPYKEILLNLAQLQQETRKKIKYHAAPEIAAEAIQAMFLHQILIENLDHEELRTRIREALNYNAATPPSFKGLLRITAEFFYKNESLDIKKHPIPLTQLIEAAINLESLLFFTHARLDSSVKTSRYFITLDFFKGEERPYIELAWIIERIRTGSMTWTGISSGQKAYLNMFSSIWSTLTHSDLTRKSSSTLLCIDEADLYLHPQWQVEFVERLIYCLPTLSNGKKQIVITTHSPILVSDLPSQCLIALPPPPSEHDKEPPATDDLKTFGANLFDIYSSTFGLHGQRTGNLSSKYISKILQILDCDDITYRQREALKQAASIIDDELIKSHILRRIKYQ
ncbi:AAA family ATPase [Pseudomonas sp. PAGU 2196]|uniref:AAA family ATPase n=1 Tax=Pseudomonas sp. PAGU 2196 TaxID=2793997 RepID=UPI001EE09363|nr:AAA family ATPase [Pseudomonas sp. PAGU 2196]